MNKKKNILKDLYYKVMLIIFRPLLKCLKSMLHDEVMNIHRHIDTTQRDILIALGKNNGFVSKHNLELVTRFPVATNSNDHLFPVGTIHDNTRYPRFIRKCEDILNKKELSFLDLGCSGGGLVLDAILRGHLGIGLEGSNLSFLQQRAEWRLLKDNLFTCDIAKEFILRDQGTGSVRKFDIITAWEVLEHISEQDLLIVLENIKTHLSHDGYFLASISSSDSILSNGINLHQTVKPRDWWERFFESNGFSSQEPLEPIDMPRGGYNPPLCYEPECDRTDTSMGFVLSKLHI